MRTIRSLLVVALVVWFGCGDNNPSNVDALSGPACSDGADNDGDGTTDFPDDLGCESADSETEDGVVKPKCSDNRDNDGDGKVDYPSDPGCPAPNADDEGDPCPDGENCPQCGDGEDNDGNGKTDFPEDSTGCVSAADLIEFTDNPTACGQGMVIKMLPTTNTDMGTLAGTTSNVSSPCGGGNNLPAVAYVFHINQPRVIVASTDDPMTMINTVLDLRSSMCSVASSEITCHDDITPGTGTSANLKSKITRSLKAGTYYLIVGGKTAADVGQYNLKVEFLPGEGTPCTTVDDCGPTLLCRIPVGQTTMQCAGPVCFDGVDDDGDGKIDYPIDPGCTLPTDTTETDVCATMPTDPQCPLCGNGLDDDMDGMTDYPADSSCVAASTPNEACPQSEAVIVATTPQTTGTTVGAVNDYRPPPGQFMGHACSSTSVTAAAPDVTVQLDVPALDSISLRLSPVGFDSAQILFDASCTGTPLDCYDSPTLMALTNVAAGRYFLIIDGWSTAQGTFTLNVSGTIKAGESCELPLATSGALVCAAGTACGGTAGSRTCIPAQCNDGIDNNSDGRTDYPADPGCVNTSDNAENTVCPGTGCPVCSDGVDNDGDGTTDYPMDQDCISASATNEGCRDSDVVTAITSVTTTGTLVGATDDHNPACVASNFADKIYTLDIPTTLQSLDIDTEGSAVDTVLSLLGTTCEEPAIACDDDGGVGTGDSLIHRGFVNAGSYAIAVDSDLATLDTFNLNVRGVIAPGGSCENALFQAGVLECPPLFGCNGPAGSRTCSASQCNDGVDNNSDGLTDFPADPGCTSTTDNVEDSVCPGSGCPVCFDGLDNDSDGRTDFPMDPRCTAASGTAEGCVDRDAIATVLMPTTNDTLVGARDDHQPVCVTTAGVDKIYSLTVPNLDSLSINTNGSTVVTVLSLMNSDCIEPAIACDDDSGIGSAARIERPTTPAGTYTIAVDADTTVPNSFVLNVSGVISPGASCESPLFATGVLRCSMGFACDGPVGMRTCSLAQCVDGVDNDNDGSTDFPADVGCETFSDNSETNNACPGPQCPVCSDGIDNDGDGATDFPMDSSCVTASWNNEACNQSEPLGEITAQVTYGDTTGHVNDYQPSCATSTAHVAPELVYRLQIPQMATLSLNVVADGTTVHALLNSACGATSVACSTVDLLSTTNVAAGTYYVVVDGSTTAEGPFILTTTGTVAPGGSCEGSLFQSGAFTCTANHSCAGTQGTRTCTPAQCTDALDNDGDGKTNYPADPGCASPSDNDESDDCFPTVGPNCPICSDGMDNDGDGNTDYPMDTSCHAAAETNESCVQSEGVVPITDLLTIGTNTTASGAVNDNMPTCTTGGTAPDRTYQLDLPSMATLDLNFVGIAGVHSLLGSTCGGTPIACSDPELMSLTNLAAGKYFLILDGATTANGTYTLMTTGTVAPGGSCEGVLFQNGAFSCTTGHACAGTMGSRTCSPARCNDTTDNDADGKIDYPADPGCTSASDDNESDDCSPTVGPNCPVCSNGIDDDIDTLTDYPTDNRCIAASFFAENFCAVEADIAGEITRHSTAGTLVGAADNYDQSCQVSTLGDVAYGLKLPVPVDTLVIDTYGSFSPDTVVSVWNSTCSQELACDDDSDLETNRSVVTMTDVAAGTYAIQVDAFGTTTTTNVAPFLLNVRGTVAAGTACTSELFGTGVLVCPTGTSCTAGTCQ